MAITSTGQTADNSRGPQETKIVAIVVLRNEPDVRRTEEQWSGNLEGLSLYPLRLHRRILIYPSRFSHFLAWLRME